MTSNVVDIKTSKYVYANWIIQNADKIGCSDYIFFIERVIPIFLERDKTC